MLKGIRIQMVVSTRPVTFEEERASRQYGIWKEIDLKEKEEKLLDWNPAFKRDDGTDRTFSGVFYHPLFTKPVIVRISLGLGHGCCIWKWALGIDIGKRDDAWKGMDGRTVERPPFVCITVANV